MKNLFIVFEGGDFSGKTTQVKLLAEYLRKKHYDIVVTKEPGGTEEGAHLREKLLYGNVGPAEELELFFEDRRLHVENVIRPALREGKIVISDRYSPSTLAYQGAGRGFLEELIREKDEAARGGLWPHIILLLDADPKILFKRARDRDENPTTFEKCDTEFQERVRNSFRAQAREDPEHWQILDTNHPPGRIAEDIRRILAPRLRTYSKKPQRR